MEVRIVNEIINVMNVNSYSDLMAFIAYSQQYHVAFDLTNSYIIESHWVKCARAPVLSISQSAKSP